MKKDRTKLPAKSPYSINLMRSQGYSDLEILKFYNLIRYWRTPVEDVIAAVPCRCKPGDEKGKCWRCTIVEERGKYEHMFHPKKEQPKREMFRVVSLTGVEIEVKGRIIKEEPENDEIL